MELEAIYASAKSFYKKAKVEQHRNKEVLVSYDTFVAEKTSNGIHIKGYYSPTTARHINEYLQQNGLPKLSKKEMCLTPTLTW